MKNILIFMAIYVGISFSACAENINECKTDIYYGNGVWNEYEVADDSRSELESLVKDEIINGNTLLQAKYGKTKLAYNWGQGAMLDVLETYYQLREAGQLDGIGFFAAMAILIAYQPELMLGAIAAQKLWEPFTKDWEQGNVDEMWEHHYYHESFKLGHRVLLVSHSQGNLFANRIYDTINPTEYKRYFANVQVASPASEVKAGEVGKGSYVTLWGDPVINPIPGSMSGNANGFPGHAFVSAYLGQQDPYDKIVSRIKAVLTTLDVELTQWDTDQEFDKNTCNEKVTVKHHFDLAVDMPFKVYPFNLSKKLYQVNGEWVKASCGGKNILDAWDGKKDNECWLIDNVEEEKIVKDENVTELPYDSLELVLLRRYFSPNPFANCFPLVDVKIVIAGDGNALKFIDNPSQVSGGAELTKFISTGYGHYSKLYSESVFYMANSLTELNSNIDTIWKITVPKYTGWGGIGAVQCPSDKETISYKITQDDLDLILKK